jgi:hypothetical protein
MLGQAPPDLLGAPVAKLPEASEATLQRRISRIDTQSDDMHRDALPGHRDLDAGHESESEPGGGVGRLLQSFEGVVIGQRHDLDPSGMGAGHQLGRRQSAIRGGGVCMQVEAAEHGALSYQLAGLRPFINNPQPEAGNRHLMLDFRAMKLPPADLSYVLEQFDELTEQLDDLADIDPSDSDSPIQLREAMRQLLSLLARLGEDRSAIDHPGELTGYGEYGIHILDQLADVADEVERPDLRQTAEQLSLPFALWVVRNGGELRQLGTVVNALSHLANHSRDPATMANLYGFCCELIEAASPS